jgi:LssY-like putative type I secretion system component LssY
MNNAITKEKDNVRVSVSVLTEKESREYFGRSLTSKDIQAVWLRVENHNPFSLWLLPSYIDPEYYSALEVAFLNHGAFSGRSNHDMDEIFEHYRISRRIPAGAIGTGFIFTNLTEGMKQVNVELWHSNGVIQLPFYLELPDIGFDYQAVDFENLYKPDHVRALSFAQLRRALALLPCCTGSGDSLEADPLNVIFIGHDDDIFSALVHQGWDPTHSLNASSVKRTVSAYLLGRRYRYAPISPLELFNRQQDIAFQKARGTIHQRNHMRLWLSPYTYRGRPIWVGQISRDIGVRFSAQSPFFITHRIDPEVDESRDYLVEDMLAAESLEALAYVDGVGAASIEAPRQNLTGDPYFTDGMRAVMFISTKPVAPDRVRFIRWETAASEP